MLRPSISVLLIIGLVFVGAFVAASPRFKRGTLSDEADRVLKQGAHIDTRDIGQLVDVVEKYGAQECLARVICELSSGSKQYGEPGAAFGKGLLRFRSSRHPKAQRYIEALNNGSKLKNSNQCKGIHPACSYQTNDVVMAGNKLLRY